MKMGLFGWVARSDRRSSDKPSEAERLIREFGVNAYEEARRRRNGALDPSAARYWSEVKSEIGRTILDRCHEDGFLDRLEAKILSFGLSASAA